MQVVSAVGVGGVYPLIDPNEYLLTVRVKLNASDDPSARQLLQEQYSEFLQAAAAVPGVTVELQELVRGKPPRKVKL